jgi:hypothetical protein
MEEGMRPSPRRLTVKFTCITRALYRLVRALTRSEWLFMTEAARAALLGE